MSARKLLPVLSPILTVALALALGLPGHARAQAAPEDDGAITPPPVGESDAKGGGAGATDLRPEIGRASGRERGEISGVAVSLKKKKA